MRLALVVAALATLVPAGHIASARAQVAAPAPPAPPQHAIGAITVGGSAEPVLAGALRAAATEGLTAGGAALVPPDSVSRVIAAVPELGTCNTADCHTRLASAVGAARLITIAVDAKGELYALDIALLDGRGRALRRRTDECVACAVPELQERVTAAVRDAIAATSDDTVTLIVDSTPSGAELEVDGAARGTTPWKGELMAGPHQVTATAASGASIAQELFVEASPDQRLTITIPHRSDRRRWGNLTYAAAGVGAATIIGGIVLLSMDGNGTCDAAGSCPRQYETTFGGLLTVTAGLALAGTAGWMYWRDHSGERALTVAPTGSGATMSYGGRF